MPATTNASRLQLAQARIGAVQLGIPAANVVHAMPVPESLSLLPVRGKALRGVIEHGGVLVPVIDLARWIDVGSADPLLGDGDGGRILVLREDGRSIGLLVEALGGLVDADAQQVARLHHGEGPEDLFHSAVRLTEGPILSLLEVGRLADLALTWSADRPAAQAKNMAADGEGIRGTAASDVSSYALLDCGRGVLGVRPVDLAEVITMPVLERLGGGIGARWCTWRGRHLAVLPGAALIGGEDDADEGAAPLLAVFAHGGMALGVPMHAVLQLRSLPPGLALAGGVTSAVFDVDGAEIHLIDTARLFAYFPEAALSTQELASSARPVVSIATDATNKAGVVNSDAYIVFETLGLQAVPIGAVEHILPLAEAAGASIPWRGTTIPLVDLRAQGSARTAPGHVLVARGAHGMVGYVVARVQSLIPAGSGRLYRMGAGQRIEFITAGQGLDQASYRIVELSACT